MNELPIKVKYKSGADACHRSTMRCKSAFFFFFFFFFFFLFIFFFFFFFFFFFYLSLCSMIIKFVVELVNLY